MGVDTTQQQAGSLNVVYALVVLYALCYQLQSPLEPFLVDTLVKGEAAATYARLVSFFSLVQMVGSMLVGFMLDHIGLRGMFAINFLACALSYAILARATSIELLFASKLPALFQAGFLCAQTAAAKLTADGPERSTALGRLTSAYTIGGVVGPALGGTLGVQTSAQLAVVGSFVAIGLVWLLPTAVEHPVQSKGTAKQPAKPWQSWTQLMGSALPLVWPLLATKMASGFVNSAAGAARPLVLKEEFRFDQSRLGAFMSATFLCNALVGLQLGRITTWLGGEGRTCLRCLGAMAVGYAMMALAFERLLVGVGRLTPNGGVWVFMSLTLLLSLFQFPLATTLTSTSTSLVPSHLKGSLVGVEHATFALAGLLGPSAGVALLESGGLAAVAAAASAAYLALLGCWCVGRLAEGPKAAMTTTPNQGGLGAPLLAETDGSGSHATVAGSTSVSSELCRRSARLAGQSPPSRG